MEVNPWKIGWESIQANRVATVALVVFAILLSAFYFLVPGVRDVLEPLKTLMTKYGNVAAFASMVVFMGFVPGVIFWVDRSIRPAHPLKTEVLTVFWKSGLGVLCTEWFHAQDALFGAGTDLATLAVKTAVDQFLWTPLVLAPLDAIYYFWAGRDYSPVRVRAEWPKGFVRNIVLPNLLMGWCIGIPTNLLLYAFPVSMRIVFSGFLGSFWMLVCLQIGKRSAKVRSVS